MKNFKKVIGKANIALASLALGIGLVLPTQQSFADGDHSTKECVAGVVGEGSVAGLAGTYTGFKMGTAAGHPVTGAVIGGTIGTIGGASKGASDHCF